MEKTAYQTGVEAALAGAGLEKTAVLPALGALGWLSRIGPWAARALAGTGARAAAGEVAAAPLSQGVRAAGGWMRGVLKPGAENFLGSIGSGARNIGTAFQQGGIGSGLGAIAKSPLVRDTAMGSVMMGGVNSLTAEKGDRLKAFGRGAAWGVPSGIGFAGVSGLMKGIRATQPVAGALGQGFFRRKGTQLLTSPFGWGTAATMGMPTGAAPHAANPNPSELTNLPRSMG